ncbi:glycosyltransferase family 39 protein [Streptomyces sp. NPDC000880]
MRAAEYGYDFTLRAPDGRVLSNMAFFPLLPWLEEGVHAATDLSLPASGLLISAISSILAAWAIFHVARFTYGDRAGVICVALWAALPVGIVQSMAYSESLFVAVSAWALFSILRKRWILAGVLAAMAGLTRPVGLAVTLALLFAVWHSLRKRSLSSRNERLAAYLACLIAPAGAASYILWVGDQRGSILAYLDVQDEWGNGFDGGWAFAHFIAAGNQWVAALTLLVLLALAAWPHYIGKKQLQPAPVLLYSAIVTILAIGASGYFGSKPRLLLPAFPILIPIALTLTKSRPVYTYIVLALMTTSSAIYGAFWLNGSGPP